MLQPILYRVSQLPNFLFGMKGDKFPILKDYEITEVNGKTILEVTKEFNVDVDKMNFE